MKIKLLTLAVASLALFSCNKSNFNVNIDLQNAEGKMVYLNKMSNKEFIKIDSASIQNGKAFFTVENGEPTAYYSLNIKNVRYPINFFSENQDIYIVGDINDNRNISITGSNAQQLINEYNAENSKFYNNFKSLKEQYDIASKNNDIIAMETINNQYNHIEESQMNYQTLFLTKNSDNFIAPYILYNNRYYYDLNELEDFVNNFNIENESEFSKLLNDYISVLQRVDIGQPYIDITQETPEGNLFSLSQLVGKSKLIMLDFWASWCGPCRAENPNVVEVYNKYHEKGLNILGVSLDMQKENWIKAIEEDGLVWHHVSDLKYWSNEAAQTYGISSIPSNVLIDESGKIIAKNLTGEDLNTFVSDYLE